MLCQGFPLQWLVAEYKWLVAECRLQGTRASVVAAPRLQNTGSIVVAPGLQNTGSIVSTHRPSCSVGRESTCNVGDPTLIPELGRSAAEGIGYPLQYSYLENSMDRGAWWATVYEVAELDTTE